jgi:phosphatidylethanolamine-binding protein (PEBP) family uncharacterized protein
VGDTSASAGTSATALAEGASGKSAAEFQGEGAPSSESKQRDGADEQRKQSGPREQKPSPSSKLKHPPIELPKGPPEKGPTKAQRERVPTANIAMELPRGLTNANTCEGINASPELHWGTAPSNAVELIVLAASVKPVKGKLYFDWAMAGLDPGLEGLKEGEVPDGAVLGRNGAGQNKYSICPSGGTLETYIFAIYPVTKGLSPKAGFDPLSLRKEATRLSDSVGVEAATYGPE